MTIDTPTPEEFAFVFDSWGQSYRKSPWAGTVPNHLWDTVSRETARTILDRGALVLVAVTPIAGREDEFPAVRRVMGYTVSEPKRKLLHWVYVKNDYRGTGIGARLLETTCPGDDEWRYTHRTHASSRFLGPRFTYDPVPARVK